MLRDLNGPEGYTDPNELGAPTVYSFVNHGMDPNNYYQSTRSWAGKFDLTSQINNVQELKFGAEARFHELTLHSYQIVGKLDANGNTIEPFEPAIPDVADLIQKIEAATPFNFPHLSATSSKGSIRILISFSSVKFQPNLHSQLHL